MREIFPGVHHWTAFRDTIGVRVSSYWVEAAGVLIDPLEPEEGLEAFERAPVGPQQVVLTSGLHHRHAQRFADAFSIPIRAPREAEHRGLGERLRYEPYRDHEELAPGVQAVHVGVLAPDEYALHLTATEGAIAIADAVQGYGGELAFFPDDLLGDDPQAVERGLQQQLQALLERDFEHLLLAHGDPVVGHGEQALRAFATGGADRAAQEGTAM